MLQKIKNIIRSLACALGLAKETRIEVSMPARPAVPRIHFGNFENDFSPREVKTFSIARVMRAMADGRKLDGLEAEMSAHLVSRNAKIGIGSREGIMVPTRALVNPRASINVAYSPGDINTVTTGDYIDALRNRSILGKLPITVLQDLRGKLQIPRTTGITSYWPGDGTAPTAGAASFDSITLSDKPIAAFQDVQRSFLKQTSVSIDIFLRDQLLKSISTGLCDVVMNGTGGAATLLGILNRTDSSIITLSASPFTFAQSGTVPFNLTGGAMTWGAALAMESLVELGNVDISGGAYAVSPALKGTMKTVAKTVGSPRFIWGDGEVNSYPALATGSIPNSNGTNNGVASGVFGNWPDLLLGFWGSGIDLTLDPFTLSPSGGLRFAAFQNVDMQLRNGGASFCRLFGVRTQS